MTARSGTDGTDLLISPRGVTRAIGFWRRRCFDLGLSLKQIWGECVVHLGFRQRLGILDDVSGGQTGWLRRGGGSGLYAARAARGCEQNAFVSEGQFGQWLGGLDED
ncbi:hypothetical protein PIB30_019486, partial [Stylosanthes scabra]|nr:hypothetical protein [Stylosanthes scabra]